MPATYEDANLVMQIVRWSSQMGLEEAAQKLLAEGFEPEKADMDDPAVRRTLHFGEVIGTFVKQGVLDRGLVLDLWWMAGLWSKVGPAAKRERQRLGEPRMFENFEALAAAAG